MRSFRLNGRLWYIKIVNPYSTMLIDRTGYRTIGTTDPDRSTIYISSDLRGHMFTKVLLHEIGHCAIVSFGLMKDIHRVVYPEYWIEAEEWICNYISDYGLRIYEATYSILGDEVWRYISYEIGRMIY